MIIGARIKQIMSEKIAAYAALKVIYLNTRRHEKIVPSAKRCS
jgi:hypothetical protein